MFQPNIGLDKDARKKRLLTCQPGLLNRPLSEILSGIEDPTLCRLFWGGWIDFLPQNLFYQ